MAAHYVNLFGSDTECYREEVIFYVLATQLGYPYECANHRGGSQSTLDKYFSTFRPGALRQLADTVFYSIEQEKVKKEQKRKREQPRPAEDDNETTGDDAQQPPPPPIPDTPDTPDKKPTDLD